MAGVIKPLFIGKNTWFYFAEEWKNKENKKIFNSYKLGKF